MYCQSVLGIPFGSDYLTVKYSLEDRFGKYKVYESSGDLNVYDIQIGGFQFKIGEFSFQRSGSLSYFNFAMFQTHYATSDVEMAENERDWLYSLLKDKYADDYLEEYENDQGFKCYKFGTNPKDESKALGYITLDRSKGKDGKTRLYLVLRYGPIYYIDKGSDF